MHAIRCCAASHCRAAVKCSSSSSTVIFGNRTFASKDIRRMVDPRRVVSYEDVVNVLHHPRKMIIDVREPEEVKKTGKIPSSLNIPLGSMPHVLERMSDEDFQIRYNREKPQKPDELIFYCRSGRRSAEALDKALKLGYINSKSYLGSWDDWSKKHEEY